MVMMICLLITKLESSIAFTTPKTIGRSSNIPLKMAPKFDPLEQRWYPTEPEVEGADASYGPLGSLIRAGPKAFFMRVITPDQYDQAVLKYMAKEGCERQEAQGNMDAFFENPNDWQYQKLQEKKGAPKFDYGTANTSPKQVTLSAIWAGIVILFFSTFIQDVLAGKYSR